MSHIQGLDRTQILLFPEALDDYITPQNPVRVIDCFVQTLDLAELGFSRAQAAETGRPAYDPADLLKLYIYGYLHRVRSSRLLEREAHCNIEVIWLTKKLTPDHTSIARFRCSNLAALKAVCREFTLFCKSFDLFGGELVAIDGSKFKAVNNRKRNFTTERLAKALEVIDARINAYLEMLANNDTHDAARPQPSAMTTLPSKEEIKQSLDRLRERQTLYQKAQTKMIEDKQTQVSLTDPDSRSMHVGQGADVCRWRADRG